MANPTWAIGPALCVDDKTYGVYIAGEHGDYHVGVAWSMPDGSKESETLTADAMIEKAAAEEDDGERPT